MPHKGPHAYPPYPSPMPGVIAFVLLAVLTVVEYIVALAVQFNIPLVMAAAVLKALVIMEVFMHLRKTWHTEE